MKRTLLVFLSLLTALTIVFFTVDPFSLNPLGFLTITLLVYLFSVVTITLLVRLFFDRFNNAETRYLGISLAFGPTIIFALLTMSNLTFIDILLAIMLPALVAWYGLRLLGLKE